MRRLLSLRSDQASAETIRATIRDNSRAGGTNAWVLVAAIVIASVGLNVNSTAVIIGAMLISPLMGPIIGIGYGLGVFDRLLIRQSLLALATFTGISLLASTLYFLVSPLTQAQSELLARTSPTIWDVLIAFFGGAAGMIGLTRKEKTTLIPGVAIATALMPPLCTAGYGLATGQWRFFAGAMYLFTINGVFIALATLAITRVLRLPQVMSPDERERRRLRWIVAAAVTATLVPSVVLAYRLVHQEIFSARAAAFVQRQMEGVDDPVLLASRIDAASRTISLTMIGAGATPALEEEMSSRLADSGLDDTRLRLVRPSDRPTGPRIDTVQTEAVRVANAAAARHAARVAELEAQAATQRTFVADLVRVQAELRALLPASTQVHVAQAVDAAAQLPAVVVVVEPQRPLPVGEVLRLRQWLQARLPGAEARLVLGQRSKL